MNKRSHTFDLHLHSDASDGTETPAAVMACCAGKGLELVTLSDHDNMDGVPAAAAAAKELGLPFITGVEFDTEFPELMHMLGLGVDPENAALKEVLALQRVRRRERNEKITARLLEAGCDIRPFIPEGIVTVTRTHIALALKDGGFAESIADAFHRYLDKGRPAFVPAVRHSPEEIIEVIRGAGGIPVLAHPCIMKRTDMPKLIDRLTDAGLMGIEAYYPSSTPGQMKEFRSQAEQRGLIVTAGSDFHGANRPGVEPGCAWQAADCLERTYEVMIERALK